MFHNKWLSPLYVVCLIGMMRVLVSFILYSDTSYDRTLKTSCSPPITMLAWQAGHTFFYNICYTANTKLHITMPGHWRKNQMRIKTNFKQSIPLATTICRMTRAVPESSCSSGKRVAIPWSPHHVHVRKFPIEQLYEWMPGLVFHKSTNCPHWANLALVIKAQA